MSEPLTVTKEISKTEISKSWGPISGILWVFLIYLVPQIIVGLIISIYPVIKHWNNARAQSWIDNATSAQFVYTLLVEAVSVLIVWSLIRYYKSSWKFIGLMWPKLKDIFYALSGFVTYFIVYAILIDATTRLIPSLNINQQQSIGFNNATTVAELLMAFASLVILPPIAEEIIFRGFLYQGLRRKWSFRTATVITSVLFATPHLLEGAGGLLWVGAIDTFVLSIILCYLREKTGRLAASMGVHALKNGVAFIALFILHTH